MSQSDGIREKSCVASGLPVAAPNSSAASLSRGTQGGESREIVEIPSSMPVDPGERLHRRECRQCRHCEDGLWYIAISTYEISSLGRHLMPALAVDIQKLDPYHWTVRSHESRGSDS